MSIRKERATIIWVGPAACGACCAGSIIGFLAAIGIGATAGFAMFGAISLVVGALAVAFVVHRRRRRAITCSTTPATVAVEMSTAQTRG